ncbi:acyl carrier protein [Coxiella burnetii]
MSALWSKLLGIPEEKIKGNDNFFDLGGSSLS